MKRYEFSAFMKQPVEWDDHETIIIRVIATDIVDAVDKAMSVLEAKQEANGVAEIERCSYHGESTFSDVQIFRIGETEAHNRYGGATLGEIENHLITLRKFREEETK